MSKTEKSPSKIKALKQRFFRFLWSVSWKCSLAFFAFMLIAGIYFDQKIEVKLDGQTWVLPAQVYARPLLIKVGGEVTQSALIAELRLLNYRPVLRAQARGLFAVEGNDVIIYRRGFDFPDVSIKASKAIVHFSEGHNRF